MTATDLKEEFGLLKLLGLLLVVFTLSACAKTAEEHHFEEFEDWVMLSEHLNQQFIQSKSGLEGLSQEAAESGHRVISVSEGGKISACCIDDSQLIDDRYKWVELFKAANVDTVVVREGQALLYNRFAPAGTVGDTLVDYAFVRSQDSYIVECSAKHSGTPCGGCIKPLDRNWKLYLHWYPEEFLLRNADAIAADPAVLDELSDQMESTNGACLDPFRRPSQN